MKRLFGILLVLTLCLGFFAVNVYASGEEVVTVDPVVVDGETIDISTSAPAIMSAALDDEGHVALKNGNYEEWIDRLDLTGASYASDFYDWLVEQLDHKASCALAVPDYSVHQSGGDVVVLGTGRYAHPITTFNGSLTVYYEMVADENESIANMEAAVSQAVTSAANAQLTTASSHVAAVYYAFNRDQMWAFWLSGRMLCGRSTGYSYSGSDGVATVNYTNNIYFYLLTPSFDIRAEGFLEEAEGGSNGAVSNCVSILETEIYAAFQQLYTSELETYDKVELFHDWLTENNHYNLSSDLNAIDHHCRTAYGALVQDYDPVCEGYARAFKLLCDWQEIPCVLVDGTANGVAHMWNYVQMDDGKWYAVDVTWDDPVVYGVSSDLSGYEDHDYFLVGADTLIGETSFLSSHPVSNKPSDSAPAFTNGPVLNNVAYSTTSGSCGADLTWHFDKLAGTLTISGSGAMPDFSAENPVPWNAYADDITEASIGSGVTAIGDGAFTDFSSLAEITIPESVTAVGENAFDGCSGLEDVYYDGEMSDWYSIVIESGNDELHSAEIHFTFYENHSNYKALSSNASGQLLVDGVPVSTNIGGYYLLDSGYYYLAGDVSINNEIYLSAGDNVTLCLDSHVLRYTGEDSHSVFVVSYGTLTLVDCGTLTHKFSVTESGQWVLDETNGTETVTGGVITGGNSSSGGAISIDSGRVYQKGCNLVGNYGYFAGGVYLRCGWYYLDGGSILGNGSFYTGGVYSGYDSDSYSPVISIKNSDISYNYSDLYAGAMYINGTGVSIKDTDITNNKCKETGGIRINYGGKMIFAGNCSVTGNVGSDSGGETYVGGGINLRGSMEVSGKLVVDDNYCDKAEDNIRVWFDGTIAIGEEFSADSSIGITAGGDVPCVITSNGGAPYISCFSSDNDAYRIITDSGEVVIETGVAVSGKVTTYNDQPMSVTVYLIDGGTVVASTTTDADGNYSFENVATGTYVIKIDSEDYSVSSGEITVADEDVERNLKVYLLGDVNQDGKVDSTDTNILFRYALKDPTLSALSDEQMKLADVNQDGKVDSTDTNVLFRYALKDPSLTWVPIHIDVNVD